MLRSNTKNPSNTETNTLSTFAFKPRQVLLAEHNRRIKMAAGPLKEENSSKITSLTPDLKGILHQSILSYLHRNGFSKTLKRFQSEAQIQNDAWKTSSPHLEDIYCKYTSSRNADANLSTCKKPELVNDEATKKDNMCFTKEETITTKKKKKGTVESDSGAIEDESKITDKKMVESGKNCGEVLKDTVDTEPETKPKKKKTKAEEAKPNVLKKPTDDAINVLETDDSTKKTKDKRKKGTLESDSGAIEDQSKVTDKKLVESGKNRSQMLEDIVVNEPETKPKKKKKTKHELDSSGQAEESKSGELKKPIGDTIDGLEMVDSAKKTKDKKKKSTQVKSEPSTTTKNELVTEVADKERKKKKKKSNIDSADEESQVIPVCTESENGGVQPDVSGKEKKSSKKRKRPLSEENDHLSIEMTTTEESKRQKTETSKERKSKHEGSKVDGINVQQTSDKQLDGQANGKVEINGGEKSGSQKSMRKQHNGSAEPKTVNAFQRVKIDQVEFAHEKLQDNSYWAKDGADTGYGAKAQEVLGQVRGRDFRHEKTKKKRGSYRGGFIDLQSHSIKFDYSDEE